MAVHQQPTADTYRCPECDGELLFAHGSWGCTDCRYAPPHGAD